MNDTSNDTSRFPQNHETDDPVATHSNAITYTAAALFAAVIIALIAFAPSNNGTSSQIAVNSPLDNGPAMNNPRMPPAKTPAPSPAQ